LELLQDFNLLQHFYVEVLTVRKRLMDYIGKKGYDKLKVRNWTKIRTVG